MTARIALSVADRVATLTLAAPERRNAIDLPFTRDFAQAALDCASTPTIRAVVLRAEGPVFSVGGDLADMLENRDRAERHVLEMASFFHLGIERLRAAPAPVIVALRGTAAGGGFSLVLGGDLVIAGRSARLVAAYTRSGLSPDGGATWLLPRLVGRQKAFALLALNPVLDAQEAERLGLVTRVVEDEAVDAETQATARQIAGLPGEAIATLKRQLEASQGNGLREQLALEAEWIARNAAHTETLAALEAFFKR
jgi:2-(1,2-epoxy-1,2-dihydrophenyl)acetyl-CoA isomerase